MGLDDTYVCVGCTILVSWKSWNYWTKTGANPGKYIRQHFTSIISVKRMSIRVEVNFGQKHQLLYCDYHSNGFYPRLYVSNKPDNHFVVFSYHFICFFLFLKIKVRQVT